MIKTTLRIVALVACCLGFVGTTLAKSSSSVTLASSLNPSPYAVSVTFTATVTPSAATGTVTFKDGTTTLGTGTISSGKATYTTTTLAVGSHSITGAYGGNSSYNSSTSSALTQTVNKATPTITWATPAAITYGTALSGTQLNATASAAGTFAYTPASGTVLTAGTQTLSVTFTPTTTADYTTATGSVSLVVNKATPTISWSTPAAITYGTALTATQLNATASVPGTFAYTPASGTVPLAGTQTLSVTLTPTDTTDYTTTTSSVSLTVNKVALTVTAQNASRAYGLSNPTFTDSITGFVNGDTQSVVSGAASLTTTATTSSTVGTYPITAAVGTLSAANYTFGTFGNGMLTVTQATPTLTWTTPAAITYGTALGATQLNATAGVPGTVAYTPSAGTILPAGTNTLSVKLTPTDATDYTTATTTVPLTVNKVNTTMVLASSSNPSAYGSPVTFTAALTPSTATGTITFLDGTTTLGTGTVSGGMATYSTSSLATGSHSITASYPGDANDGSVTSSIVTESINPALQVITTSLPAGTAGTSFSSTLSASGGATPYVWSVSSGSLPAGLSLAASTGAISGVPTLGGTSTFAVQVTDANNNKATQSLSIAIAAVIAGLSPVSGPTGSSVTISGSGFGANRGTSTVTFNGTAATTFAGWTASSIAVTVPTGATTGNVIVTIGGVASNGVAFTLGNAYANGYQYRRTIVLAHADVPNTDQTDFPALISGVYSYLANVSNGGWVQSSNGYDIVFSQDPAGATKLDHEIDSYDPVTGTVNFWIRIPTLSHTVDTVVYMFYGNSSVTVSQENKQGVWRNGYAGVWHFGGSTALNPNDSTTNANNATNHGVTPAAGKISGAGSLDGTGNTYLRVPSSASFKPTQAITLEEWVMLNASNTWQETISLDYFANGSWNAPYQAYTLYLPINSLSPQVGITVGGNQYVTNATSAITTGQWAHLVGTFDGSNMIVYANGTQINATPLTGNVGYGSSQDLTIGAKSPYAPLWGDTNGLIDEVRISTIARSADWVATEYANQSSPSTFYAVAGQETPNSPPTMTLLSPSSGAIGEVITIQGYGFQAAQGTSTVTFNGTAATPTSWNDASIILAVPIGASTGSVIVTVNGVASNAVPFTVYTGYTSGYQFRRELVLNHINVSNSDQKDFPVLISGVYSYLANTQNGGFVQSPNGYDVIFSQDPEGATKLDHEIDSYDPVTGTVSFWVRIPTLSHTADTLIYVLYGNPSVTFSQENKAGVWKNNYLSVYHLGNGTAVGLTDSASADYTLGGSASAVSGKIGGGASFNGSTYLYHDSVGAYPAEASAVTLETWVKLASSSSGEEILGYGANSGNGSRDGLWWDGSNAWMEFEGYGLDGSMPFDSNWHHLVSVYGGGAISTASDQLYRDGVPLAMSTTTAGNWPAITTTEFKIGGIPTYTSGYGLNGSVDEVRVSAGIRSADWVATEYANESSPSTFYTVEGQTTAGNAPIIQLLSPTTGAAGSSVLIEGAGFQSTQAASAVTFNGLPVTPISWNDASILVTVPAAAAVGSANIIVTVGGVSSNAAVFTVMPTPSITNLNPASGVVGALVTITGSGFGNTQGASIVTFAGTIATPTIWSSTAITVPVPIGATTGNVMVTVGGGTSNLIGFTIIPSLAVTGISPSSGMVGTYVTITGTLFGGLQGSSTVSLNSAAATVANWSDTSITAVVPAGATSGPFSVTVNGQVAVSPAFNVTTLPTGWTDSDVGAVHQVGSATYSGGTFTVSGGVGGTGNGGITANADAMNFVYQTLVGDGSIVARLTSLQNGQGAIMIRESLNPAAADVSIISSGNMFMQYRPSTGAGVQLENPYGVSGYTAPTWMKIVRTGSLFTGYASTDGVNWTSLGSTTVPMAQSVDVGLAASGYASVATASFDSVSLTSSASAAPVIMFLSASTATVGSQIQVIGSGFGPEQNASVLLLNGSPITVSSWDDTLILFTVPSGATSGPLVVSVAPEMNSSNPFRIEITGQPLPSPWLNEDVGVVGQPGSATYSGGTFSITGTGGQFGGTADAMQFVYQPLTGDGSITTRVLSGAGGEFGLMIRETLTAGSTDAFVTFANSVVMQYRSTTGGSAVYQSVSYGVASPYWLQLVRAGSTLTGFISNDGVSWTQIGSTTIAMAPNVYIGMVVSGYGSPVTATFDSVSINSGTTNAPVITGLSPTSTVVGGQVSIAGNNFGSDQGASILFLNGVSVPVNVWSNTSIVMTVPAGAVSGPLKALVAPSMNSSNPFNLEVTTQPLPTPWSNGDIGAVSTQIGSSTFSNGVFTLNGGGLGIGGTADAMQFVYQPLVGDGSIVAHLTSTTNVDSFYSGMATQAGVMIRETLNSNAADASVLFGWDNYVDLQDRPSTGSNVTQPQGLYVNPLPEWLKLVRTGNVFTGFGSSDDVNWTQLTTATVPMAQTVYIGLALSGDGSVQTATFDNVSIVDGTTPFISGITPLLGTLGSQVTIAGSNFGATQGTSTISFNGALATSIISWVNNQIVALVPSSALNGTGPIIVTVNLISTPITSASMFTVINPVITNIEPPNAPFGGTIIINGSGFGAYQNGSVLINGVVASPVYNCQPSTWFGECWSDTQIQATVSYQTTNGPLTVSNAGFVSNAVPFAVSPPPNITSDSPGTGVVGTPVTINGSGFGATQSNSSVAFGGVTAVTTSNWSDSQITVDVPPSAITGPVTVTVAGITAQGPEFILDTVANLTASNGVQTTYTSTMVGGTWSMLTSQGPGCSSCSARGNVQNTYDLNGHLLTSTDPNGNTVTYTYDSSSNVLTRSAQLNGVPVTTTYTYNSLGEVLTTTDPLGNTTTNTYDANGNLLTVSSPAPNGQTPPSVTQFTYNTLGELTKILDPLNHPTTLTYTSAGLINTITDAQNHTTSYAYDSRGNRTSVIDPINGSSHPTTFAFDAMNRLTGMTYPDGTSASFGYDYRGRRTSATDQNNKTTLYAYDDADRLVSVTDAANNLTQYNYDTEGNLTSIADGNNHTTSFDYDYLGRVTKTTFPSTLFETYGYDGLYNLTSKTDRKNQTIQYVYDSLYRMTSKTYPDQTAASYVYDLVGKIQQVTDPTGTYGFAYDNMGRLIGTTTQYTFLPGHNFQNGYTYDAASNRKSLTAPDGSTDTYNYDTLNRLATLTNSLTGQFGFGYDALSRRTQLTRPNGVNTNYNYDSVSHLLSVLHQAGSTTLDGASYGYDFAGNRTSKTNYLNGITSNYGYDAIYELLQVTQGGSTTESYSYDAVGNRLSSTGVPTYSYNSSNELTSNSSGSYTYDNNGNTLTDASGKSYTWDFENRMVSAVVPGTGTAAFKYDPLGRRIQKSSPLGTTNYLYDGLAVIEEADNAGNVLARYTDSDALDESLAMLRGGTTSYYQADGVGSTTSLSNADGALAKTYTFDSFGKVTASTGTLTNPFQYTGREFDPETGLYFYRARYLDSSTGRFLSEDPIQFVTGAPYFYASNSPLNFVDPSGLAPGDWWDPRTPGNVWNQLNPFNPNGSLSNTATSVWDSLSGMATGNWSQVAQSYDRGPYGQIGCQRCKWRTAETTALAGSGAAATAAGGLILLDAAGISNVGETQIGWKGGEITFTRPGCKTPDFRINPFGDDDWPPHYHRRPGIGRHRPWEGW